MIEIRFAELERRIKEVSIRLGVLLFLIGWGQVWGAEIRGIVVDKSTGNPLPDVSVLVDGKGATTNLDGHFRIEGLEEGKLYQLKCSHLSYEEASLAVRSDGSWVRVELTPRSIPLREVVVTMGRGVKGETPGALFNLPASEVRRENTILEPPMLAPLIPNATSFNWGGYTLGATHLRIRGFDSNRLSISINGIPANDPEDHNVYWQDTPDFLSHTHDIQVERGVSHFRSGPSGIGGGLNLVTADAVATRELSLGLQWGHLNTASEKFFPLADRGKIGQDRYSYRRTLTYRSGLVGERYNFTGRFSQVKSDGYRDHSQADEWLYFLSATRYDPNLITRFQVYGGQEETGLNFNAIPKSILDTNRTYNPSAWYGKNYQGENDHFQQPHYILHQIWRPADDLELNHSLFWIHGFGYYEQYKTRRRFSEYRGALDTTLTVRSDVVRRKYVKKDQVGWLPKLLYRPQGRPWEVMAGMEARQYWSDHYGRLVWTQNWSGVIGPDHQWYRWKGDKRYLGGWGEVKYSLSPDLNLSGGLEVRNVHYQMDQDSLGPFRGYEVDLKWTFVNPRVGVSYRLGETSFYFSLGQSGREPIDEQILDADNPRDVPKLGRFSQREVKPEKMTGAEVGLRHRWEDMESGLNFYAMFFRNEIINTGRYLPDYDILEVTNALSSRHLGVEWDFKISVPQVRGLSVSGDVSLDRSVFTDRFIYYWVDSIDGNWNYIQDSIDANGNAIPLTPQYVANLRLNYDPSPWRLSLNWHAVSQQYLDPRQQKSHRLKPYDLLNLGVGYRLNLREAEVELSLNGLNLLNREYEPFGWTETLDPSSDPPVRGVYQPMFIPAAGRSWMFGVSLKL